MQANILLTGATGNTGTEVVRQLLGAGRSVRVLAHSAESAGKLPAGVDSVIADFDDMTGLERAFAGVEAAYALTPINPKSLEWMQRLIDVAKRAGLQRFVKLSGMTAGSDSPSALIRGHGILRLPARIGPSLHHRAAELLYAEHVLEHRTRSNRRAPSTRRSVTPGRA